MSIQLTAIWVIECDEPGCDRGNRCFDRQYLMDWLVDDGWLFRDGKHYCHVHAQVGATDGHQPSR